MSVHLSLRISVEYLQRWALLVPYLKSFMSYWVKIAFMKQSFRSIINFSSWCRKLNLRNSMFSKIMNEDGHTSSIKDKILSLTVFPGWYEGTRITFPKEGDQGPNTIPGKCFTSN